MSAQDAISYSIAEKFTTSPGSRYRSDGDFSGEEFYEDHLKPIFDDVWSDETKTLKIDFDGTYGYASSFLSEVFTKLITDYRDLDKVKSKLEFKSEDDAILEDYINEVMDEAFSGLSQEK